MSAAPPKEVNATHYPAVTGCVLWLVCLPIYWWLFGSNVQLVWNTVLAHYFPVLPVVSVWGAIAIRWSVRIVTASFAVDTRKDERPTIPTAAISQVLWLAILYGASSLIVTLWKAYR